MMSLQQQDSDLMNQATLFVGLGAMGTPMAARLAGAGYALLVTDAVDARSTTVADDLGAKAVPRDELAQSVSGVRAVILMLPDSPAVEDTLSGEFGLLAALPPGCTVIDMGSSKPSSTVSLATAATRHGVVLIDAPVSGGVSRAVTGELAIMVGG